MEIPELPTTPEEWAAFIVDDVMAHWIDYVLVHPPADAPPEAKATQQDTLKMLKKMIQDAHTPAVQAHLLEGLNPQGEVELNLVLRATFAMLDTVAGECLSLHVAAYPGLAWRERCPSCGRLPYYLVNFSWPLKLADVFNDGRDARAIDRGLLNAERIRRIK